MANIEQLRNLDELSFLVNELKRTVNEMYGYVRGVDAYDRLKEKESQAVRAEAALGSLRAWIQDGSHGCTKCAERDAIEADRLPPESCTCFLGHAPCSFCENSNECTGCGAIFYDPDEDRDEPLCEICDVLSDDEEAA